MFKNTTAPIDVLRAYKIQAMPYYRIKGSLTCLTYDSEKRGWLLQARFTLTGKTKARRPRARVSEHYLSHLFDHDGLYGQALLL